MRFWSEAEEWTAAAVYPTNIAYLEVEGRRHPWSVDFYCVHLVLRGPLRFYSRGGELSDLAKDSMFLIEPHVPFYYHSVREAHAALYMPCDWRVHWCGNMCIRSASAPSGYACKRRRPLAANRFLLSFSPWAPNKHPGVDSGSCLYCNPCRLSVDTKRRSLRMKPRSPTGF